jgi:hypothetical protein
MCKDSITIHLKPGQLEPLSKIINEGGWGKKTGIKQYIYRPINLHGDEIRCYHKITDTYSLYCITE